MYNKRFFWESKKKFDSLNLKSLLCPDINHINFTLNGFSSDIYFKFLRLNLTLSDYGINNLKEFSQFY